METKPGTFIHIQKSMELCSRGATDDMCADPDETNIFEAKQLAACNKILQSPTTA